MNPILVPSSRSGQMYHVGRLLLIVGFVVQSLQSQLQGPRLLSPKLWECQVLPLVRVLCVKEDLPTSVVVSRADACQ